MSLQFERKKQSLGALYGFIAAFAFALAAWGMDSFVLLTSHVTNPLLKFLPGLFLCVLAGSLTGWLSVKIGKGLITIILWVLFALILVWLVLWIPFKFTPTAMKYLHPELDNWIDYPVVENIIQFRVLGLILITSAGILCGVLQMNIIDGILMSSHKGAILSIIFVCGVIMSLAGFAADELTSKHFREPAKVLDDLIQFAYENMNNEVDEKLARRIHLSTVKDLDEYLPRPRKLTLVAFDTTLGQMDFIVDFDGIWVKCTTIYTQPTFCQQVTPTPVNYFISPVNESLIQAFDLKIKKNS